MDLEHDKPAAHPDDDLALIREYATSGSGEAFARVMARHVDMVYSTCRRRLGETAAAEDATQAAFVSLARKAPKIAEKTVIAGWLYRAARYEAAQLARRESVRRRHEMAAAEQRSAFNESTAGAEAPHVEQLAASECIDRALERLGDAERHAIVLRYFSGRSFAEVAREMRTTEEAARKRVSRGLERLRAFLVQRAGTAATAALPVAAVERVLTASLHTAPPSLTASTLHAVATTAAGQAASVGGGAAAATKGALITMALTKAKVLAGAAAAVLLFGGGAVVAYRATRPPQEQVVTIRPGPATAAANWRGPFNELYALRDGETFRNVLPPFIPERQAFWDDEQHHAGGRGGWKLPEQSRFTMEWDGKAVHWTSMSMVETSLGSLLQSAVHLHGWELDRSTLPLSLPLPGDWVTRKSAATRQRMDALAQIVSAQLGREVHFVQRALPADTLVVRGAYHFTPLDGHPDNGVIEVGERLQEGMQARNEPATVKDLLNEVEQYTQIRTFDETGAGHTRITIRDWHMIRDGSALIAAVAKQTGLTIAHEQRPIAMWSMVDSSGQPTTAVPPGLIQAYALPPGEAVRCVRPPYVAERARFWNLTGSQHHDMALTPSTSMVLKWDGRSLEFRTAAEHLTLEGLLGGGLHLDWKQLDDAFPMSTPLKGDWVIRDDAPLEDRLNGVAKALSEQLGRPVHFERRASEVEVIVVSGSPQKPADAAAPVLFADSEKPRHKGIVLHTPSPEFLRDNLPALLHRRVIVETTGSAVDVAWQTSFTGSQVLIEPSLEQLTKCTGLQFRKERRQIELWGLVDGPATAPHGG